MENIFNPTVARVMFDIGAGASTFLLIWSTASFSWIRGVMDMAKGDRLAQKVVDHPADFDRQMSKDALRFFGALAALIFFIWMG